MPHRDPINYTNPASLALVLTQGHAAPALPLGPVLTLYSQSYQGGTAEIGGGLTDKLDKTATAANSSALAGVPANFTGATAGQVAGFNTSGAMVPLNQSGGGTVSTDSTLTGDGSATNVLGVKPGVFAFAGQRVVLSGSSVILTASNLLAGTNLFICPSSLASVTIPNPDTSKGSIVFQTEAGTMTAHFTAGNNRAGWEYPTTTEINRWPCQDGSGTSLANVGSNSTNTIAIGAGGSFTAGPSTSGAIINDCSTTPYPSSPFQGIASSEFTAGVAGYACFWINTANNCIPFNDSGNGNFLQLDLNGGTNIRVGSAGDEVIGTSPIPLEDGAWHHVGVQWDGVSACEFFVAGASIGSLPWTAGSFQMTSGGPLQINSAANSGPSTMMDFRSGTGTQSSGWWAAVATNYPTINGSSVVTVPAFTRVAIDPDSTGANYDVGGL